MIRFFPQPAKRTMAVSDDGDDVPAEDVPVGVLEEDAAGVVGEEVPLGDDVVARLEEEADRREAAVPAGTGSAGT